MSALTKIPPFILANSRTGENFIIHTKGPRFIARIFRPELETEELEIKAKFEHHIEIDFKARRTIIVIIELWDDKGSVSSLNERLQGKIKTLKHWYISYLNENENDY